eukprot:TRINITY_DN4235_c0_g1_i1.p3 TRINITY_DN4235_c0_g1~~TRINITY_DN4235_c0_g1_i1.p3  ORF type:complete len:121 (-),score=15.93 TRINITY_DN4235_c0_g1_i1:102-464(-)
MHLVRVAAPSVHRRHAPTQTSSLALYPSTSPPTKVEKLEKWAHLVVSALTFFPPPPLHAPERRGYFPKPLPCKVRPAVAPQKQHRRHRRHLPRQPSRPVADARRRCWGVAATVENDRYVL